jgi:hypothetical protein
MAAGCAREARYLAAHGDGIETRFKGVSDGAAQRANCPNSRRKT